MTDAARPRDALVAIDMLRFAAASLVMLCHYFGEWALVARLGVDAGSGPSGLPSNDWFSSGWVGVEIFFVISGYVIAMSANNSAAIDFARRRLLRLWPGALVCATITALALLLAGVSTIYVAPRFAASAMMFLWAEQIDPVYWSLLVECVFYALVTVLLAIGRWNPVKVGISLSLWTLIYLAWVVSPANVAAPAIKPLAEFLIAPFGAFFGIGILLQQAHRDPASVKGWMFLPSLLAAPVCIGGLNAIDGGQGSGEALMLFVAGVSVVVLSPRLQLTVRSQRLRRLAIALGLATYPLYLLHAYAGQALMVGAARLGVPPSITVGPVILLMVAMALLIALRIEPVIRARMDQLLRPFLRPAARSAA
ncbi:MAG: acyltransferase [Pseudomonadota bacterium]|nr:acyltransferase [Pseudomonadota bacterium]